MTIQPTRIRRTAMALACCCLLPFPSWAADNAAQIRAIVDTAIRPVMAEYDVPGMAVAVTMAGKPVFLNYGVASREDNTPVSETTLFELGSVSKTFTATLAAYAQAQGKLSLDDHAGKYMPQLKGRAIDKASLLHLGTYTAGGLPLQLPEEVSNHDQMIAYYRDWKPDAAPGAQRRYSNPSLGLFGHVTALALHSDFADAMESRIFPAFGMNSTYIRVPTGAMPAYAWGYNKANKPVRVNPGVFADETYGVKSTAADMIRFVQANIEPKRLEAPMRRAVEASHIAYFKVGEMVQGLGWEQYPYPVTLERLQAGNSSVIIMEANAAKPLVPPSTPAGPALFNKTGSTNGFGAYVAFVPEQRIGIVMLANRNLPIPARVKAAHAILEQLANIGR